MTITTDIPARLDRLPWSRFHTLVVVALGITWILDGIEVTLAGAVAGALKASPVLHLSNADVGFAASAYLVGAVIGALGGSRSEVFEGYLLGGASMVVAAVVQAGWGVVSERRGLEDVAAPLASADGEHSTA